MGRSLKPASRSNGTRTAPAAHFVTFSEEQNTRLHAAAKREGVYVTEFLRQAALRAIKESEGEADEADARKKREKKSAAPAAPPPGLGLRADPGSGGPVGLGIRERVMSRRAVAEAPPPEPEPPAVVIAQVAPASEATAGAPASASDDLGRLASYVAAAPAGYQREQRAREVTRILAGSTDSADERLRLARALEDQVALLEGKKPEERGLLRKLLEALS